MKSRTGQSNITKTAKSDVEPVMPVPLPLPGGTRSKHIGRPKGSLNKKTKGRVVGVQTPGTAAVPPVDLHTFGKVKKSFDKLVADGILAQHDVSEPDFDGGGTSETGYVVTKESLERRVARRLNVLDRYLTDDRLLSLLALSSLKEIGIYEGIMLDKSLVLKGQPTVIIGSSERAQLDDVLPRLLAEVRRRKLITSVSERKITFTDTGGSDGERT